MAKRVGDPRAISGHASENLRSMACSFREAIEKGNHKPAPEEFRADALSGMWNFARVRRELKEEASALAAYFTLDGDIPADYLPRIARMSVAMYLLDKIQEISEGMARNRAVSAVALFDVARRGVERVLDESFFMKSPERIMGDYLDAEPALVSCASLCSVRILSLEEAVKEYKMKAAEAVEAALAA